MRASRMILNQVVAEAVEKGLTSYPKRLPSWLFYDENGDRIFQQIMRMPSYYLTRCEYEILQQHRSELLQYFMRSDSSASAFRLIELGAGDGLKTEILLRHFLANGTAFSYVPVDISSNALKQLSERLATQLPALAIKPLNKTYDEALASLSDDNGKKIILFMGANIGNFTTLEAVQFLKKLALPLSGEDMLLIGFDLKKDPRVIQKAYDDPDGLTARFNLNILTRLNRELGATFNDDDFSHFPYYDPETGATKSFLISLKDQSVYIEVLEKHFHFSRWEAIHTEVSQKYDVEMIEKTMSLAGLEIVTMLFDREKYFTDVVAKVR